MIKSCLKPLMRTVVLPAEIEENKMHYFQSFKSCMHKVA